MKNTFKPRWLFLAILCFAFSQSFSQDIYTAVRNGDVALTREILAKDPGQLNQKNLDQLTPLNLAAEQNQVDVAALLLELGADPSVGDRENSQPIHLAAVSGSIPIIDLLLEEKVDIDSKDINGMTALLFASSRGQVETVKHLLDRGADPKAKTTNGLTSLHLAAISGRVDLMKLLVSKGAQVNTRTPEGYTPLHSACAYGRTDAVKYLADNGADMKAETDDGAQPLAWAVGRNSLESARYLIQKGADVNHRDKNGFTALHDAAGRGNVAVAELLIDSGADINAASNLGLVPLAYAAWAENSTEMGRMLLLRGADVNPDPCLNNKACTCGPNFMTPLHAACMMGRLEMAEALVNSGAKVNLMDAEGMTPLHFAVRKGNVDITRYLVDHGAFLNVKETKQGMTELHMAAAMGYGDIAKLLTENGSCFEMKDQDGKTPVDYAFYYGQNKIGYELLAAGADDANLATYVNVECLLAKPVGEGEASIWFLGHSGWAIKTQNHFLVFDYFDDTRSRKPDCAGLMAGCIDTTELKGVKMNVFCSHDHADHYNPSIFSWNKANPGSNYILCFNPISPAGEYTYIPVSGEANVDGMDIYVNKSTDLGGGYLVEVDGLNIFYMGDHANGDDKLSDFTQEIDLIAEKNVDIDLLFGPIRGCSLGTPEQVKTGIYYTLEKLHPALFVPMHSGNYSFEYRAFVDQAREDGVTVTMKSVMNKGDRFRYSKTDGAGEKVSSLQ